VADDQKVFAIGTVVQERLELSEGGGGGEGVGVQNLGLVAGLGADEGGGLEAAFERARDDEIELNVKGVQHVGELEAMLLALLVERTLDVEERVGAAYTGAGMTEDVKIHSLLTF
jgi:hypothetical protein